MYDWHLSMVYGNSLIKFLALELSGNGNYYNSLARCLLLGSNKVRTSDMLAAVARTASAGFERLTGD